VACQMGWGELVRYVEARRVLVGKPAIGFVRFAFPRYECGMVTVTVFGDVTPASQAIHPSDLCFDRAREKDL
jgi:hypothetical protein